MYIDKKEVLRYLGHRNQYVDDSLDLLIDETIEEIRLYIQPKSTFKIYEVIKVDGELNLKDTSVILKGENIKKHLEHSQRCAVMATTLGNMIESKIKYYQKINLTKALILDSCATTAIESYSDEIQEKIKEKAIEEDLAITYRYSPGYGDLPINIQKNIISVLEADKKIGLTVTENYILLPRKSITAIIGFQAKDIIRKHPECNNCLKYKTCKFVKEGSYCGK